MHGEKHLEPFEHNVEVNKTYQCEMQHSSVYERYIPFYQVSLYECDYDFKDKRKLKKH